MTAMDFFVSTKGGICTSARGPNAQKLMLGRLTKRVKSLETTEDFFELVKELWTKCKFEEKPAFAKLESTDEPP